jgi:hypothetical protein
MSDIHAPRQPLLHPPAATRLACASGALGVTTLTLASLLGLFHHGSSGAWQQHHSDLMAQTDACQRLPGRTQRLDCTVLVVAAHLDRQVPESPDARDPNETRTQ